MPRSRNIKPSFFTNERLAECSFAARLLFIGLWTLADREGRLEERLRRIGAEVFPYDDDADIEELLGELTAGEFIVRYRVDGRKLIEIPNFSKHQRPHANEKESDLPPWSKATCDLGGKPHGLNEERGTRNEESGIRNDAEVAAGDSALPVPPVTPPHDDVSTSQALAFPVVGKGRPKDGFWRPSASQLAEWAEAYPDLDTLAEIRKARQWVLAKDRNRKTATGMAAFLVGWFNRSQNAPSRGQGVAAPAPKRELVDIDSMEFAP